MNHRPPLTFHREFEFINPPRNSSHDKKLSTFKKKKKKKKKREKRKKRKEKFSRATRFRAEAARVETKRQRGGGNEEKERIKSAVISRAFNVADERMRMEQSKRP